MNIKTNDNVKVVAGKDKGKSGKVIQVFPEKDKVVVEGVNTLSKHLRRRSQNEPGQKVEFSAPLHVSNVRLVCPKCSKESRVGKKLMTDANGKTTKARLCKKCKEIVE